MSRSRGWTVETLEKHLSLVSKEHENRNKERFKAVETLSNTMTDRIDRISDRVLKIEAAGAGRKEGIGTLGTVILGTAMAASAAASLVSLAIDVLRHG